MHLSRLPRIYVYAPHVPCYRGIHADVIVYIFAHLHKALATEIYMLDMN